MGYGPGSAPKGSYWRFLKFQKSVTVGRFRVLGNVMVLWALAQALHFSFQFRKDLRVKEKGSFFSGFVSLTLCH